MKMLKKMLAILLCLCALAPVAGAEGNSHWQDPGSH